LYNLGNTCFANATYKLIARCSGFDTVLSQDIPNNIHTALRNIVNGIRLGKRSALCEKSVNEKLSAMFLDQLVSVDKPTNKTFQFNDRGQHMAYHLLLSIMALLYPEYDSKPSSPFAVTTKIDIPKKLAMVRHQIVYESLQPSFSLVKTSQFYIGYYQESNTKSVAIDIPELITIQNIDPQTKQPVEKIYKRIAIVRHIGSTPNSGHYIAYIRHEDEWYEHNDAKEVNKKDPGNSINTFGLVVLYELKQ